MEYWDPGGGDYIVVTVGKNTMNNKNSNRRIRKVHSFRVIKDRTFTMMREINEWFRLKLKTGPKRRCSRQGDLGYEWMAKR